MKYRNNLTDLFENAFFEVIEPFDVHVPVGQYESNTFIGSSRLIGILYKRLTLNPGDHLYDLHGGVFVLKDGTLQKARMQISDKHPFEKTYSGDLEIFPVEKLKKISKPNLDHKYSDRLPEVPSPKSFYGRSIDSII